MYTLEFYDRIRGIENQYNFSHPISPQQALDIFNKIGFEVYPYGVIDTPLGDFDNKDVPMESFRFSLSSYNYIDFDKTEIYDYLLEELWTNG